MTPSDPEHRQGARPFGPTDPADPAEMTGANVGDTGPAVGSGRPGAAPRHPVDRNDGFFGTDIPVEDRPHGEERKNPGQVSRRPTFPHILAALFAGAVAGFIIWWSLLTAEGQAWAVAIAVLIVIGVAVWRGFEPAIAASIAAAATVVGVWVYMLAEEDDLYDSIVDVAFVGVGTMLALIIIGGVTAAVAQGVRSARHRRATGDRR